MNRLPAEIASYLLDQTLLERSPLYLRVSRDLRLLDFDGDGRQYGISHLERGLPVTDQIHFLTGLLPISSYALVLPCIQIDKGRWADVHIIKDGRHF